MLNIFKNELTLAALKSILTISVIAALAGAAAYICDKSFWATFCIVVALQYMLGYILSVYVSNKFKYAAQIAELDKLEKLSTIINCAYCNTPTVMTFLPEEVPSVTCEKCNNVSAVKLHFTVARTVNAVPETLSKIINEPQKNHNIKY